jgi:hypothetical protein
MAEITTITTDGITIVKFTDGIAEIIVDPTKVMTADILMRAMTMHGVTAAKIIRIQTAKEIPPPRFDQEGGGQSTP